MKKVNIKKFLEGTDPKKLETWLTVTFNVTINKSKKTSLISQTLKAIEANPKAFRTHLEKKLEHLCIIENNYTNELERAEKNQNIESKKVYTDSLVELREKRSLFVKMLGDINMFINNWLNRRTYVFKG